MRISFIIPCYNVSKTLYRCLDSVYALGMPENEFDVIAVDDASTDDTLSLLQRYASEHTNLQVHRHLVNRCLGAARNTGLAVAQGEFIAFVDSDDEVLPGILEALKMAEEKALDMVAMRVVEVDETGENIIREWSLPQTVDQVFTGEEWLVDNPSRCHASWSYVYLHQFLKDVHRFFVEGLYYEDVDYECYQLHSARRVAYCGERGIRYYKDQSSISNTFSIKHVYSYACLAVRLVSFYDSLSDIQSAFAETVLKMGNYYLRIAFRWMTYLKSRKEVRLFYNLFDSLTEKNVFMRPTMRWNKWTWLCLHSKSAAILLAGFMGKGQISSREKNELK